MKELFLPIRYGCGWIPEPVWTFWRRGKYAVHCRNQTTIPWSLLEKDHKTLFVFAFLLRLLQINKDTLTKREIIFKKSKIISFRTQWPRGLRRGSGAARILRLWV